MPIQFTTDGSPGYRRLALWQDIVCDVFVGLDCKSDLGSAFRGSVTQAPLGKVVQQAPLGESPHPILPSPAVSFLGHARDETSAAIVTQHPSMRPGTYEPCRAAAARNRAQFAARRPVLRIEQRLGSDLLRIAKAIRISQHDARCSGNALAALYHSNDYLKLQTAAAARVSAASLGNRRYLPCTGGASSLPSGMAGNPLYLDHR